MEAQAEARERAWAQRVAAARRAAQAQQAETTGPRTIEDYEALRRNLPSYRPQPSQAAYEAHRRNLPAYRAQPSQAAYEALRQNLPSYAPAPQEKKPWWQKAGDWLQQKVVQPVQQGWNTITHPGQSLENALVQWGAHSSTGYNVIRGLASMTASMNDPERNPVTAAFGQALRDGIAGFSYGVRSTIDLARRTGSSLLKGDWEGVRRYGGALLEGTVKGWIWGSIQTVGHLAWGAIKTVTPIGLFETVPAWTNALQEARAGKRGGWDVALTSLFLMANLIGIAGAVNGVQTQATRTALIREYGEPVRPLLAERQVIPILKNGELAPKPWTEYVLPKYQENVLPAFENQSAVAVKLNDMVTVYLGAGIARKPGLGSRCIED